MLAERGGGAHSLWARRAERDSYRAPGATRSWQVQQLDATWQWTARGVCRSTPAGVEAPYHNRDLTSESAASMSLVWLGVTFSSGPALLLQM